MPVNMSVERARRCMSVWNMVLVLLAGFLTYIVISTWIKAFITNDYRGLIISLCLLLGGGFACWRSRAAIARRRQQRNLAANAAYALRLQRILGEPERTGVPDHIRTTFDTFKAPTPAAAFATGALTTQNSVSADDSAVVLPAEGGQAEVDVETGGGGAGAAPSAVAAAAACAPASDAQVNPAGTASDAAAAAAAAAAVEDGPTFATQCGVCLSDYAAGEVLCRLPCPTGHVFHEGCISQWLDSRVTCPYCKYDLVENRYPAAAGAAADPASVEVGEWEREQPAQ